MKYFFLFLIFLFFNSYHPSLADEVKDKTDSSFVGDGSEKPINSSFAGDISNSVVDESWGKENVPQKTDSSFVGEDISQDNSFLAGSDFDQEVKEQKDAPFAEEKSPPKDTYGQ